MQHRRFGRTGLQIPSVTFGGGWVGGVLIHHDQATAHAALDLAWEAGIDWIDTAAQYGNGVSETVIGAWLKDRGPAQSPGISTKFRIDPDMPDPRGQMLRSVDESLNRLGRDRVDVIFLHNQIDATANRGARSMSARDALVMADTMETLVEQGLCSHLGMTALGEPAPLHEVVAAGRFDVAQVYYNMLNPTAADGRHPWNSTNFDGLLRACAAQDMGVMGIRIFAGGHLATRTRHGREIPVTSAADDLREETRSECAWSVLTPEDGTPAQAALRFGLACSHLSTIVVGLGDLDHLRQALEATDRGPLAPDRLAAISACWDQSAFTS